jgi:hypothetical protein
LVPGAPQQELNEKKPILQGHQPGSRISLSREVAVKLPFDFRGFFFLKSGFSFFGENKWIK